MPLVIHRVGGGFHPGERVSNPGPGSERGTYSFGLRFPGVADAVAGSCDFAVRGGPTLPSASGSNPARSGRQQEAISAPGSSQGSRPKQEVLPDTWDPPKTRSHMGPGRPEAIRSIRRRKVNTTKSVRRKDSQFKVKTRKVGTFRNTLYRVQKCSKKHELNFTFFLCTGN